MMKGSPDQPRYGYRRRGRCFYIYRYTYNGNLCVGTHMDTKLTEEEARDEVYRLNGWKKNK